MKSQDYKMNELYFHLKDYNISWIIITYECLELERYLWFENDNQEEKKRAGT